MAEVEQLSPSWLNDPETRKLTTLLGDSNCRFVGGAVRDSYLGRSVRDVDVATRLLPDDASRRLEKGGAKVIPTGVQHGTITAVISGRHFEITTLRHDVETFGRHARVAFHDDWEADAARRDFTMNALYLSPDGVLEDYFNGLQDLTAGRVRFIGDAGERIREDALRILRFFRFHAHYGKGGLDPEGLEACEAEIGLIETLSAERVAFEMKRLLMAPDPGPTLAAMERTAILRAVLADSVGIADLERLIELEAGLGDVSFLRRLASLLPREGSVVAAAARGLRLPNKETKLLVAIADRNSDIKPGMNEDDLRLALYRNGQQATEDALFMNAETGELNQLEASLGAVRQFEVPQFPVSGRDLKPFGIDQGPAMGKILEEMEEAWINSSFQLSKDALLRQIVAK